MAKLKNLKQIGFSDQMITYVNERLDTLGVSFPEYIRYLVLQDTTQIRDKIPFVTKEEEERITESIKNLSDGDFVTHKKRGDIKKYFKQRLNKNLD